VEGVDDLAAIYITAIRNSQAKRDDPPEMFVKPSLDFV
jgi:hypothetical protein